MNSDSDSEIAALRNQVYILLVALIVVSGTLTVFLYRQNSMTGKDINTVRPQAEQVIGALNQNRQAIGNFVGELVTYGQKHPEFAPVLAKYGISVKNLPPGAPPAK